MSMIAGLLIIAMVCLLVLLVYHFLIAKAAFAAKKK